jgi:hypothetical protein
MLLAWARSATCFRYMNRWAQGGWGTLSPACPSAKTQLTSSRPASSSRDRLPAGQKRPFYQTKYLDEDDLQFFKENRPARLPPIESDIALDTLHLRVTLPCAVQFLI